MQLQARAVCDENQGWELGTCTVSPAWGSASCPHCPRTPRRLRMGRHQTPSGIRKVSSVQSLSCPHSPLARGPGSSSFCLYTHIPSYLHMPAPSSTRRPPPHTRECTEPNALCMASCLGPSVLWVWPYHGFGASSPLPASSDTAGPRGSLATGLCVRSPGGEACRARNPAHSPSTEFLARHSAVAHQQKGAALSNLGAWAPQGATCWRVSCSRGLPRAQASREGAPKPWARAGKCVVLERV